MAETLNQKVIKHTLEGRKSRYIYDKYIAEMNEAGLTKELDLDTFLYQLIKRIFKQFGKPLLDKDMFIDYFTPNAPETINKLFSTVRADLENVYLEINNIQNSLATVYNKAEEERSDIEAKIKEVLVDINDYFNILIILRYRALVDRRVLQQWSSRTTASQIYTLPRANVDTKAQVCSLGRTDFTSITGPASRVSILSSAGAVISDDVKEITDRYSDGKSNVDTFTSVTIDPTVMPTIDILVDLGSNTLINTIIVTPHKEDQFKIVDISTTETSEPGKWLAVNYQLDPNESEAVSKRTWDYAKLSVYSQAAILSSFGNTFTDDDDEIDSQIYIIKPRACRRVKFRLQPMDLVNETTIGIRDISIFKHGYEEESEIISEPFIVQRPIDRIAISAADTIPQSFYDETAEDRNKWVKYYVSLDGESWHRISPIEQQEVYDTADDGTSFLVPEIIHVNYAPTDEQIKLNRSGQYAFVDTEMTPYSARIKAVLRRPADEPFSTPLIHNYSIQVHHAAIDKYFRSILMASIQDFQKQYIIAEAVKEVLAADTKLTLNQVSTKVLELMKVYNLGLPFYTALEQNEHSKTGITEWNENIRTLIMDFNVLMRACRRAINNIQLNADLYKMKRKNFVQRINKLQNEVQELFLLSQDTSGYFYSVYDSFDDTSKTDLSITTEGIIDISRGLVTLSSVPESYESIILSKYVNAEFPDHPTEESGVKITTGSGQIVEDGYNLAPFKNVTKSLDDIWIFEVVLDQPDTVTIEFKLDLLESKTVTGVELTSGARDTMLCTLKYAGESAINLFPTVPNPFELKIIHTARTVALSTDNIIVSLQKDVPDDTKKIGTQLKYYYTFALRDIKIFNENLIRSGDFYSDTLTFDIPTDHEIEKIALEVDDEIPEGTGIDYSISINNGGTWSSYTALIPSNYDGVTVEDSILDFNTIERRRYTLDGYDANVERYATDNIVNGQRFYYIPYNNSYYTINADIYNDSVEVFRGRWAWAVTTVGDLKSLSASPEQIHRLATEDNAETGDVKDQFTVTLSDDRSGTDSFANSTLIRNSVINMRPTYVEETEPDIFYEEGLNKDYTVSYDTANGTITVIRSENSAIPVGSALVFEYGYAKNINKQSYSTFVYLNTDSNITCDNTQYDNDTLKVYIDGADPQPVDNQKALTGGEWHQIRVEDLRDESDIASLPATNADLTSQLNAIFPGISDGSEVDVMYAFKDPMEQVSYDYLVNRVRFDDHSKYAMIQWGDYTRIVLNYWPGDDTTNGLNTIDTFDINYKFKLTSPNTQVKFKAALTMDSGYADPPILRKYSIKGGLA